MRLLLPDPVRLVEVHGDLVEPPLFPQEEALLARSVDKRRREFATGRRCARRALAELGVPAAPLLSGPRGEPQWPDGVVGAITHCEGYRAAAVASSTAFASLGMDAEPATRLPDGVLDAVSLPAERAALAAAADASPAVPWDKLLFSAKESVYKAWYPLGRRFLEFEEAMLSFELDRRDCARGTFRARLLVPLPPAVAEAIGGDEFPGRWAVKGGLVLTAVVLPAPQPGSRIRPSTSAEPVTRGLA